MASGGVAVQGWGRRILDGVIDWLTEEVPADDEAPVPGQGPAATARQRNAGGTPAPVHAGVVAAARRQEPGRTPLAVRHREGAPARRWERTRLSLAARVSAAVAAGRRKLGGMPAAERPRAAAAGMLAYARGATAWARHRPGPAAVTAALVLALVAAAVLAHVARRARAQAYGPPLPTAAQVATGRALLAATNAQQAATAAQTASRATTALAPTAQRAAKRVASLATPRLARKPSAQDPGASFADLQAIQTRANGAVAAIRSDAASAAAMARTAAGVATSHSAAQPAARRAGAAATSAAAALSAAQDAAERIAALMAAAAHEVTAWRQIHGAPAGTLAVTVRDAPRAWGLHGCEAVSVSPRGAGHQLGLMGAEGARHPVGDVITRIQDTNDGGAAWAIADCAALRAAMAQTRAGDRITVTYERRATMDLVLGVWLPRSGTVILGRGAAAQSICPAPIHGTLAASGATSAQPLPVVLSGPAGTRAVAAALRPGGDATYLPDALLRAAGYRPYQSETGSGVVPGSRAQVYLYHVPGSSLAVEDGGQPAALADGMLTVIGVPGIRTGGLGGTSLRQGARLTTGGGRWTLTPPCH